MDSTALSAGAAVASAVFAGIAMFERRLDSRDYVRRARLEAVATAVRDVSRDAFAMSYNGPNTLHSSQPHLRALVASAGVDLPACKAMAEADGATAILGCETAAFDEIADHLAR
jgi:hypothetical protein